MCCQGGAEGRELASRFFQLALGHAMTAPFLKEKFGWTDSHICWWCGAGRQTREHLFKECMTWKSEIRELWKSVAEASGSRYEIQKGSCRGRKGFYLGWINRQERAVRRPENTAVRELISGRRFTEAVLTFLKNTAVGKIKEGVVLSSGRPSEGLLPQRRVLFFILFRLPFSFFLFPFSFSVVISHRLRGGTLNKLKTNKRTPL